MSENHIVMDRVESMANIGGTGAKAASWTVSTNLIRLNFTVGVHRDTVGVNGLSLILYICAVSIGHDALFLIQCKIMRSVRYMRYTF